MFQRAYLAAQSLGIAERTHQAMFDAVWKTGEESLRSSDELVDPVRFLVSKESSHRDPAGSELKPKKL